MSDNSLKSELHRNKFATLHQPPISTQQLSPHHISNNHKSILCIQLPKKSTFIERQLDTSIYSSKKNLPYLSVINRDKIMTRFLPFFERQHRTLEIQEKQQESRKSQIMEPTSVKSIHKFARYEGQPYKSLRKSYEESARPQKEEEILDSRDHFMFDFDETQVKEKSYLKRYYELNKLVKQTNRKFYNSEDFNHEPSNKMSSGIIEHMNRYRTKNIFEPKLNIFKTTIYQSPKNPKAVAFSSEKKTHLRAATNLHPSHLKKEEERTSNFIKRKKLKKITFHQISQERNFEVQDQMERCKRRIEEKMESQSFSPWENSNIYLE